MATVLCGIRGSSTKPRAVFAPWATNGCGTNRSAVFRPKNFSLQSIRCSLASARSLRGRYRTSDQIAGTLCEEWADRLGLQAGYSDSRRRVRRALGRHRRGREAWRCRQCDRHVDLHHRPERQNDACARRLRRCAGSVDPKLTGIEAGLSAAGDHFRGHRAAGFSTPAALAQELSYYRAGQTGLLRLTWDNGDRTVLVNPELGGVTLGWHLTSTATDELFAAIEGTAFHTRVILERMEEHGVTVRAHHQWRRHSQA